MRLHHLCIQTDCYPQSLAFYRDMLGMEVVRETEGFHGRAYNTWLRGKGLMIELQTPKAGEAFSKAREDAAGIVHMCFLTEDLEAACGRLTRRGEPRFKSKDGQVIYQVGGGRLFKLIAPEGTVIEFRDSADC